MPSKRSKGPKQPKSLRNRLILIHLHKTQPKVPPYLTPYLEAKHRSGGSVTQGRTILASAAQASLAAKYCSLFNLRGNCTACITVEYGAKGE